MLRPEVCHVCVLLSLIRAAGGLTRRGRPPLHSRDGHSQPVNPPCCMRLWQKAPQMWGSHNELKATQKLQISTVQACTEGQADLSAQTPTCLCLPPSSCPPVCVQRDRSWPVRLSVTLMSLLSCVQMLSSHLPVTLSSYKETLHTHQLFRL